LLGFLIDLAAVATAGSLTLACSIQPLRTESAGIVFGAWLSPTRLHLGGDSVVERFRMLIDRAVGVDVFVPGLCLEMSLLAI
jgi:hypothetical protein